MRGKQQLSWSTQQTKFLSLPQIPKKWFSWFCTFLHSTPSSSSLTNSWRRSACETERDSGGEASARKRSKTSRPKNKRRTKDSDVWTELLNGDVDPCLGEGTIGLVPVWVTSPKTCGKCGQDCDTLDTHIWCLPPNAALALMLFKLT